MAKWKWILLQLARQLWVRATLIGALGIAAAVLATMADRFSPWTFSFDISAEAVESILSIIATSMLAVTTFSLSVMTAAFHAAASNVTPRATRLLVEDRVTQNVLSTFVGSFLFSIVGIVVLKTGAYGAQGRVVLFAMTVLVLAMIVLSLLRWIDHLTRLGRVGETTDRVEEATKTAITARLDTPFLGGRCFDDPGRDGPEGARAIAGDRTGYVQHIDMAALDDCAGALGAQVYLCQVPGAFVYPGTVLARIAGCDGNGSDDDAGGPDIAGIVRDAITIGDVRSYDQDPRFGFCVLSEIALRALSPGVNDPGTAIDVIGRLSRLLVMWVTDRDAPEHADDGPAHPNVHVPALRIADLFDDAFHQIARDGAAQVEVQLRLRKALQALSRLGDADFRDAARAQAALALKRADAALTLDEDRDRLRRVKIDP